MTYDQNLARMLQEQYRLSSQTLKSWKRRGGIPDEYTKGLAPMATVAERVNLPALEKWRAKVLIMPEAARQDAERYLARMVAADMDPEQCAQRLRDWHKWARKRDWT